MNPNLVSPSPSNYRLLGEMLHSLTQPLTSLHCALELSAIKDHSQDAMSTALAQTESAIRMVRLMREYVDSTHSGREAASTLLMPVLRSLGEDLASIASIKGVHLQTTGASEAAVPVEEHRLRVALQYLIQDVIDHQMSGNRVIMLARDNQTETVLQAQGEQTWTQLPITKGERGHLSVNPSARSIEQARHRRSTNATIRSVRLAIASQVFENAGATVTLNEQVPGFVVRIPRTQNRTAVL